MSLLRALAYFVEEAVQSLWRSRLINALSIGTIAVSLFVLGAFLTVAANLNQVVTRWTQKVQVTIYLDERVEPRIQRILAERVRGDAAVESLAVVDKDAARERFKTLFRDLRALPEELGENPFPASFEITLRPDHQTPAAVERFVTPAEFEDIARMAYGKGFLMVSASPLTRSSYHAGDDFRRLRALRRERLARAGAA